MIYEMFGWLHAATLRLRDRQEGQGTVEYVGMILVVGVLMAAVVASLGNKDQGLKELITEKIKDAIEKATEAKGGGKG